MIEIEELTKRYNAGKADEVVALENVTLRVAKGEMVLLKGASGSGKSTLLSIIAGLTRPSSGSIVVNGEAIAKLPDDHLSLYRNRHVGFVFQDHQLFEGLNVRDNVALPLLVSGMTQREIDERVDEVMEQSAIIHKAASDVRELSGGEKQRCAIARALANHPELILCDEPTASLDAVNSTRFLELLDLFKQLGKTVLVATHDPIFDTASAIDRTVVMEHAEVTSS